MPETIDITPNPRVLRVLGEIPFQPWQCVAELIDNSIDAFTKARRDGSGTKEPRIDVAWSDERVAAEARVLEVTDNGPGMSLAAMTNAARAGYTSNDPLGTLGLFGMGFNIATARLGERTELISTNAGAPQWQGVEIDFARLIHTQTFVVPVLHKPKEAPELSGTKVTVSVLKEGIYRVLRDKARDIRRTLEDVYAPILREGAVLIYVNGTVLKPRPYCLWAKSRSVTRAREKVHAQIEIDRDLGPALFDVERNQYLPGVIEAEHRARLDQGQSLPTNIIERPRRLRGWIGVQRYAEPNDFGIDFVRNGRKILIKSKVLFSWENPLTGETLLDYPVELGTTQGGRVVGELYVDYLVPTYQKNDFDRTEAAWRETVLAIRGDGPILPKRRQAFGYTQPPEAPLAKIVNAYRRLDPGTKNLAMPSALAREWSRSFFDGEAGYETDDKWWQAAVESDRDRAEGGAETAADVDSGTTPSDSVEEFAPTATEPTGTPLTPPTTQALQTSTLDELVTNSTLVESLTGEYHYGRTAPLRVRAHTLVPEAQIKRDSEIQPCAFFQDADECDFFYNPRHPLLQHFPLAPRDLLVLHLAEKLKARDNVRDISAVFAAIYQQKFADCRLERTTLQEKSERLIDDIRARMQILLAAQTEETLNVIHEASGEVEETMGRILTDPDLVDTFQSRTSPGIRVLDHVPPRTLARLVDRFPEALLDGKLFRMPFKKIQLSDTKATERARAEALKRLLSYLEDAIGLASGSLTRADKDELGRAAYSLAFLERMIAQ
jgi:hypothetical protein